MTQQALAEALGRTPEFVYDLVHGKQPVTAETAWLLKDALGVPAHLWMNIQTRYDLTQVRNARLGKSTA